MEAALTDLNSLELFGHAEVRNKKTEVVEDK